jgi:NAD(P)H-flavin reductase/hemoglobin-like flavoprotein
MNVAIALGGGCRQEAPGMWSAAGPAPGHLPAEPPDGRTAGPSGPAGPAGSDPDAGQDGITAIDYAILKQSFAHIEPVAEKAVGYFYARLFIANPELRSMFPLAMDTARKHFLDALARTVWSLDNPLALTEYLRRLAAEHLKFGVREDHYRLLGETLLITLRAFSGGLWTARAQAAWEAAVDHITTVMTQAARDGADEPAWWLAEVVRHELRGPDLAVLTLRTDPAQPLRYRPGQYLNVQVTGWPRIWRKYSIANAPRPDGSLDLHVRAVPTGRVSRTLVHKTGPGDTVVLGPARGTMVADERSSRDILCVAGGTGLAPIKAIIEGLTDAAVPRPARTISLFLGARRREDLYDLPDLRRLESACSSLRVIPALSHEPGFAGLRGMLPEVVRQHGSWKDSEVFVSGPAAMIRSILRLLAHRTSSEHIHLDAPETLDAPPGTSDLAPLRYPRAVGDLIVAK